MKKKIHPIVNIVTMNCSCGNIFKITSTMTQLQLYIDICNMCHPFYSGKQKIIDTERRVEFFKKKFSIT